LVDENVADLVMSNVVFNLTTDKAAAFLSAFRILKRNQTTRDGLL